MKFIDQATLRIKAGDGGHGCIAFLREKFRPKGGPCGGDGGKGGDVIFVGNQNLNTLLDVSLKKHYKAKNGEHGKGKNMNGRNGEDITINVPLGTIIKDSNTSQFNFKNILAIGPGSGHLFQEFNTIEFNRFDAVEEDTSLHPMLLNQNIKLIKYEELINDNYNFIILSHVLEH